MTACSYMIIHLEISVTGQCQTNVLIGLKFCQVFQKVIIVSVIVKKFKTSRLMWLEYSACISSVEWYMKITLKLAASL